MWFFSPCYVLIFKYVERAALSSPLTTVVLFFTGYVIILQFSILRTLKLVKGFPCGSTGKESACNAGDLALIPGLGRSPGEGKGYPLQYSCLETSMEMRRLLDYGGYNAVEVYVSKPKSNCLKVTKSKRKGQPIPNSQLSIWAAANQIIFLCFCTFSIESLSPGSGSLMAFNASGLVLSNLNRFLLKLTQCFWYTSVYLLKEYNLL